MFENMIRGASSRSENEAFLEQTENPYYLPSCTNLVLNMNMQNII